MLCHFRILISFLLIHSLSSFALTDQEVGTIESIVAKHKILEGMSGNDLFKIYSVVGSELKSYGHKEKAREYYEKAIATYDKGGVKVDPLETYVEYEFSLLRENFKEAKSFYFEKLKPLFVKSSHSQRKELAKFWHGIFEEKSGGFPMYRQFFEDQDLKELMEEKKYKEAFELMKYTDPTELHVGTKLKYDVLAKINHKKGKVYCKDRLDAYPDSYAVTMEACRYILTGKLKHGTLKELIERSDKESPSITFIIKALEDIK